MLLALFAAGLVWPHVDALFVAAAFAMVLIVPAVAGLTLLAAAQLVLAVWKRDPNRGRAAAAIAVPLAISLMSPTLSVATVNAVRRHEAELVVQSIELFRTKHGRYPADAREFAKLTDERGVAQLRAGELEAGSVGKNYGIRYAYLPFDDSYLVSYPKPGLLTAEYDGRTKRWTDRGWND